MDAGLTMSRSSEEVLLIVKHVRHKKSDGAMYMMGQRMAWMQQSKDTFSISHNYADIKVQKISPDTKAKVQLQAVMHDGGADTFHFTNPKGRDAQIQDREGVKELLQQLLPKFRNKVNSELEEKNRMLQEDPELFQLYKDLVVSGIVSAEEFWANRVQQQGTTPVNSKQDVGVSPAFLADIQPQMDGCNGLKYNLTADIIGAIFRTYPAVKKKHLEYVPDKLTEADFWTRFFQSHYFHRDRINLNNKDLFADCAKTDEQNIKEEMQQPLDDPFIDLTYLSDHNLGEGYGVDGNTPLSANTANASLIRRFNQHSTMVLKAGLKHGATATCTGEQGSQPNGTAPSHTNSQPSIQPPQHKKAKLQEKLEYSDLEVDGQTKSGPVLRLKHAERFLHGPTPATAAQYTTSEEMLHSQHAVREVMHQWQPSLSQVLSSNTAMSILSELSPGGLLMKTFSDQQLDQMVGDEIQKELRNTYSALLELLRHFWSCFPTTTPLMEEKTVRMHENLKRFHQAMLDPVKEKLASLHYHINLAGHMEEMLAAAYTKFNMWQTRRMNRKIPQS